MKKTGIFKKVLAFALIVAMLPGTKVKADGLLISPNPNSGITNSEEQSISEKAADSDTAADSGVTVRQTAFNAVTVTFSSKAEAKNAVIAVHIIKRNDIKGDFFIKAVYDSEVKDNTVIVSRLTNNVDYRITVNGREYIVDMHVGDPAEIVAAYPAAYIGTSKDKDILGNSLGRAVVTPVCTVYDADGIILNADASKIKFSTDKDKNYGVTSFSSDGRITFSRQNGVCYVTASYTFTDSFGITRTITDPIVVTTEDYVMPDLGTFVKQMVITDQTGKKIEYKDDCSYTATMNVGDKRKIAYYFEGSDGKLYTSAQNKSVSYVYNSISVLNSDRTFYLAKEDDSKNVLSVDSLTNTVVALSEGTEKICLYEKTTKGSGDTRATDTIYGVIEIEVTAARYADNIELSVDTLSGAINSQYKAEGGQYSTIEYAITDQFGEPYCESDITIYAVVNGSEKEITANLDEDDFEKGDTNYGISYYNDDYDLITKKGTITVYYSWVNDDKPTVSPIEYVIRVNKNKEVCARFTVEAALVDTETAEKGYEIVTKTKNVNNCSLWCRDYNDTYGTYIGIITTYDGFLYKRNDYIVASDASQDDISATVKELYTGPGDVEGETIIAVISDENGNPVTKDMAGEIKPFGEIFKSMSNQEEMPDDPSDIEDGRIYVVQGNRGLSEYYVNRKLNITEPGKYFAVYQEIKKSVYERGVYPDNVITVKYDTSADGTIPTGTKIEPVWDQSVPKQLESIKLIFPDGTEKTVNQKAIVYETDLTEPSDDWMEYCANIKNQYRSCKKTTTSDGYEYYDVNKYSNNYLRKPELLYTDALVKTYICSNPVRGVWRQVTQKSDFFFDTFDDSRDLTHITDTTRYVDYEDAVMTGNYTVTAYLVEDDLSITQIAYGEFSVNDDVTALQNVSYNKLTVKDGKVIEAVKTDEKGNEYPIALWEKGGAIEGNTKECAIYSICQNFETWFDADGQGFAGEREIITLKEDTLEEYDARIEFDYDESEFVIGADDKEIYINSVAYKIYFEKTGIVYTGRFYPRAKFVTDGILNKSY